MCPMKDGSEEQGPLECREAVTVTAQCLTHQTEKTTGVKQSRAGCTDQPPGAKRSGSQKAAIKGGDGHEVQPQPVLLLIRCGCRSAGAC